MPTAIGWRTSRRLFQMYSDANIGIVFKIAIKKREFFAPAYTFLHTFLFAYAHSGYNDFINVHFVGALIFTDRSNLQVYDTVCS